MIYYQRLKDLREDNDKTQEDVAALLGISRQHYSLYERGLRELPMHHFVTLAKYYNVSLDYISGILQTPRKLF
jgi:transcriptional regulator with XRE-family HTH domain